MVESWGFYGRGTEAKQLLDIVDSGRWFFCEISGRRRIGKTTLVQRVVGKQPEVGLARYCAEIPYGRHYYVQIPDGDERGVVQAFRDALEDYQIVLPKYRGIRNFSDVARIISWLCRDDYIVIIDEFQYFHRKSLAEFTSYLQREVDQLRDTQRGGLFVLGSLHTEMTAILEDRGSPLFSRITSRIRLPHWDFETLFEMFRTHGIADAHHRLFLWSLFEGVPKFYRDSFEQGVLQPANDYRDSTLRKLFFAGTSPLKDEAANWFLHEVRGAYDSLLKILAVRGPCPLGVLQAEYKDTKGEPSKLTQYLQNLVDRYGMVEKLHPIFSGAQGKKARYAIADNFLLAWLRALARDVQMARVQPIDKVVQRASERLKSHEGVVFEKMIRLLTEECSKKGVGDFPLSHFVQGYWNKASGSDIELDLVAFDEEQEVVRFGSCKRSASEHDNRALSDFEGHLHRFLTTKEGGRFTGWRQEKALYSPAFSPDQRNRHAERGYLCRDLHEFESFLQQRPIPAASDPVPSGGIF